MTQIVLTTQIPGLEKFITGKVRDVYDLGESLLIVATDRLSAFDVVLPTGIPDKGKVLTQLSLFWFEETRAILPNHLLSAEIEEIAKAIQSAGGAVTEELRSQLAGRSMLVKKAQALPVECVARGYISGSLWKDYKTCFAHGGEVKVQGVMLPVGLRESDKLPAPIFTPSTKAQEGHDESISFDRVVEMVGANLASRLRDYTLCIYQDAAGYARDRGIIIADTKFEFGLLDGELILIDEALTPDSSRFWEVESYKPGQPQPSFDKQFVRDYLETLDWSKTYPGPELPPAIVEMTAAKYREAYTRLTGRSLEKDRSN